MTDWLLGVDFGTSNTAAAHVNEVTGAVQTLALSHNSNLMPSSVYVSAGQGGVGVTVDVGDVALNKASWDPTGFIAAPKRLLTLGQSRFGIGNFEVPAHLVVAAVLRSVVNRAKNQHQGRMPQGLVLTHPEGWSAQQVRVLTDAAGEVGFAQGSVWTVSEPRAAAHYYARGGQVDPGDKVAVFDFGGGTLDVAMLTASPDGNFDVVAAQGDNALGGRNFDAAIRRWVDGELSDRNPAILDVLERETSVREQRALEDNIRDAKEVLSEAPQASIGVSAGPGQHEVLLLTRGEFEGLIEREVRRGVELARATFRQAGVVDGNAVKAIYLTGGSSRIPLVHQRVQGLGNIATLDDPKTVVAQGALVAIMRRHGGNPAGQTAPVSRPGWNAAPPMQTPPPQQSWPSGPTPAQRPPQQRATVPRQATSGSSARKWLVPAVIGGVVVVGGVIAAVAASSGGGGSTAATTTTDVAPPTTSNGPSPSDQMAQVVAALPSAMSGAAVCSPPTEAPDPVDHYNATKCTIKASNTLVTGLFQFTASDVEITAGIHSDPAATADVWRKNNLTGIVRDDANAMVVITGTSGAGAGYELQYLDRKSGLDFNIDGFSSQANAKTFLTRVGL